MLHGRPRPMEAVPMASPGQLSRSVPNDYRPADGGLAIASSGEVMGRVNRAP